MAMAGFGVFWRVGCCGGVSLLHSNKAAGRFGAFLRGGGSHQAAGSAPCKIGGVRYDMRSLSMESWL